jgi:hypothetical protein
MSTYGSRLRARLDLAATKQFGQVGMAFPESFFEEIYQQKLLGGFDAKKICDKCNVALPKTNHCDYCE